MARPRKVSLFDGHLLIPFEDRPSGPRLKRLTGDDDEVGRFLVNASLYDRIVVPTVDFSIVMTLALWLTPENFIEALESRSIQIVRHTGALGYHGNGVGLALFTLRLNREGPITRHEELNWAPADQCLSHLGEFVQGLPLIPDRWPVIRRLVLDKMVEIQPEEFDAVAERTYRDIDESLILRTYFRDRHPDLKHLRGIAPNQSRWLGSNRSNDDIDTLLHMAQFNWESYVAERLGADDQVSGPSSQPILQARIQNRVQADALAAGYLRILDLNRFPDLREVLSDDTDLSDHDAMIHRLWRARNSKDMTEFRQWFHANVRDNPEDAERRFVDEWARPVIGDRFLTKTLRYLAFDVAPSLIPGLSPIIGAAVNALDAFLLDRFLRPTSPKVMLDRTRAQIVAASR